VKQVLKSGGAAREFYISDLVTHVIATDTSFPQFGEAKECNLTIVQVLFFCLLVFKTSEELHLPLLRLGGTQLFFFLFGSTFRILRPIPNAVLLL